MRGRIESISSVKDRKQIITVVGNGEHNGRLSMFEKKDNPVFVSMFSGSGRNS